MATVDVVLKDRSIVVRINGALHLRIPTADLLMIHSWHYDANYFIEFTLRDACAAAVVEHDNRDTWLAILAGLDKVEW